MHATDSYFVIFLPLTFVVSRCALSLLALLTLALSVPARSVASQQQWRQQQQQQQQDYPEPYSSSAAVVAAHVAAADLQGLGDSSAGELSRPSSRFHGVHLPTSASTYAEVDPMAAAE